MKPENVCLCVPEEELRIKLIDLGTAIRCPPGEQRLEGLCGTPVYVAPEVAAWVDLKSAPSPYGQQADCPSPRPSPRPSLEPKPKPEP